MNKKKISALTLTAMLSSFFLHGEEGALHITGHSEPYTLTESALPSLETPDTSSEPAQDGGIVPLSPAKPEISTTPKPTPSTDSTPPLPSEEAPAAPKNDSSTPSASESTTSPMPTSSEEPTAPAPEEEGTPVGHAAKSGARDARNKTWQNIGLAAATVAVAVTAIILVSSNSGHRKS